MKISAKSFGEEQFQTLANAIPQLCWMAQPDGWIFWYNERWYEYTGTTPEQMEGWGWQSVHDPEVLPEVLERWKNSIATGKPFDMVFPLRGADGVFHPFLTRVMPVYDQEGKVNGWFGTNTDISEQRRIEEELWQASEQRRLALAEMQRLNDELEKQVAERTAELEARKRAEEALGESEQRLRLAVQVARIGTFDWNVQTGVNVWTPELEAMYGLAPGEFGKTQPAWEQLVRPEDRAAAVGLVKRAFETGQPVEGEWRVVWRDGSVHWILGYFQLFKDAAGTPLRLTGVNIDITERKRAEAALRQSEEQNRFLADLLERSDQPFGVGYPDGRLWLVNGAFERLTGFSREELNAMDWAKALTPPEWREIERAKLDELDRTGQPVRYEKEYLRKDGSRVPIELLVHVRKDGDGRPAFYYSFLTDLTQRQQVEKELRRLNDELGERVAERTAELEARKRAEEAIQMLNRDLEQRNAQLAESNRDLASFTYSVAHDLRSPLRGMDGFSLALLEEYGSKLDEQAQNYLKRIRGAAVRMGQLIDDLLNLLHIWQAEVHKERVDLSALALAVASGLQKSDPERPVDFVIQPSLEAEGDPRLLRVVLENLLSNAWKFSAERRPARIELGMKEQDGRKTYFVRDNGAGFDMAYAGKLFGPFQRLHGTTEFPGSGVGLAAVERIVRKHGGEISAEGAVGRGATFYFTLGKEVEELKS